MLSFLIKIVFVMQLEYYTFDCSNLPTGLLTDKTQVTFLFMGAFIVNSLGDKVQ